MATTVDARPEWLPDEYEHVHGHARRSVAGELDQ